MTLPADHWAMRGLFVLDTETTGIEVETALIGSISAGPLNPDGSNDIRTAYCPVDMPEEAGAVNGLTTAYLLEHGQPAPEALDRFLNATANALRAGRALVIANAAYDLTVLDRECRRHEVTTLWQRLAATDTPLVVADPIVLDKRAIKYRRRVSETQGARQLKTLCQVHQCGWDDVLAHTSEYDALQAGRVTYALLNGFPMLARLTGPELHAYQVSWYQEQAESLAGYFRLEAGKHEGYAARLDREEDTEGAAAARVQAAGFHAKAASVTTDWPYRPWGAPAVVPS